MSLLIKNGKIYQNGNLVSKNIFVDKGKIRKITSQELKADKVIDAKDKVVIPGLIDSHVHMREPGLTQKEDFLTGSHAAAAGGITTFLDMPNTKPPTVDLQRLDEKRKLARKSVVNYGFHFGSTKDNISEIKQVKNVASVKIYFDYTTGDLKIADRKVLKKIFSNAKIVCVHAEDKNVFNAVNIAKDAKKKMYLCHVSSKEELDYADHDDVYVEVCPHHLFLTTDNLDDLGSFGEMKPHLKTKKDQEALWMGIKEGKIDTISTDHAPHLKEEKMEINYGYGVPGLETMLPLLLNALNNKKITLKKIIELCCENPAKIFKIKNKGFIKEGYDADLTIIDMNLDKEVKNDDLFTKCKWSPFDGWNLQGWPVFTIVNGNLIFERGKINNIMAKEVNYYE
jgi:dihydroorotase|tara:strand:- start:407 stop:1594 length:1188 start_codon:yes stop_codon:yes gene_type:complete